MVLNHVGFFSIKFCSGLPEIGLRLLRAFAIELFDMLGTTSSRGNLIHCRSIFERVTLFFWQKVLVILQTE